MKALINIIIPTLNNQQQLYNCLQSLLHTRSSEQIFKIIVVNNGHPDSINFIEKDHPYIEVVQVNENIGWCGAITEGLKHSDSEFVMFLNDDTVVPTSDRLWLNKMVQYFKDPTVGAVGPSSNTVLGLQNMLSFTDTNVFLSKFLIGFCVLMRRSAFDEIGGMDMELPGGDDFDWSIRLRDAGYKLIVDKNVFVFHYGFQTGNRVLGDASKAGGWNSIEYQEASDLALIRKHGFAKWWDLKKGIFKPIEAAYIHQSDQEGELIRKKINIKGKKVLDLGCGANKTWKEAIGVDIVPKDQFISQLGVGVKSQADVEADISLPLPFAKESVDVIVTRHTLEHMLDPITTIINWTKVLKVGGKLVMAIPNEMLIQSIPMNPEHVHAWTPKTFQVFAKVFENLKLVDLWDSENGISFTVMLEKI